MSLQSQYIVKTAIDGHDVGEASGMSGGDADSEETKFAATGREGQEAQGGRQTTDNVVVTYKYDPRAHDLHFYRSVRGSGEMIVKRWKSEKGKPVGEPDIFHGILKAVRIVEYDANGNDVDTFRLEQSTNAAIS